MSQLFLNMLINSADQPNDYILWVGKLLNGHHYRVRGVHPYTHRSRTYTDVVERREGKMWVVVRDNSEAQAVFDAFLTKMFKTPDVGLENVTYDLTKPIEMVAAEVAERWPGKFVRLNSDQMSAWIHDGKTVHVVLRSPSSDRILWSSTESEDVSYRIRSVEPYVLFGTTSDQVIEKCVEGQWVAVTSETEKLDVRYMHLDDMFAQNGAAAPLLETDLTIGPSYLLREMGIRFPGLQVRFRSDLKVAWVHDTELNVRATLVHKPQNVLWVSKIFEHTVFRVCRKEGAPKGVRNDKFVEQLDQKEWKPVSFMVEMAVLDIFLTETFFRKEDDVEICQADLSNRVRLFAVVHSKWPNSYTKVMEGGREAWVYNEERVLGRLIHIPGS